MNLYGNEQYSLSTDCMAVEQIEGGDRALYLPKKEMHDMLAYGIWITYCKSLIIFSLAAISAQRRSHSMRRESEKQICIMAHIKRWLITLYVSMCLLLIHLNFNFYLYYIFFLRSFRWLLVLFAHILLCLSSIFIWCFFPLFVTVV